MNESLGPDGYEERAAWPFGMQQRSLDPELLRWLGSFDRSIEKTIGTIGGYVRYSSYSTSPSPLPFQPHPHWRPSPPTSPADRAAISSSIADHELPSSTSHLRSPVDGTISCRIKNASRFKTPRRALEGVGERPAPPRTILFPGLNPRWRRERQRLQMEDNHYHQLVA